MSATGRGSTRVESDYYPTPTTAFLPLLPYVSKDLRIWEPASGDGRLIRELTVRGYRADGNDISKGYDFLECKERRECILTNPPFSLAFEFAIHSVNLADEVFLLLRINFIGSTKRKWWFEAHEPSALFVITPRPSFNRISSDASEYAWFYWGKRLSGIHHLS